MPIARNMGYTPISIPQTDINTAKALAAGIIEALKGQKIDIDSSSLSIIEERLQSQLSPAEPMEIARVAHKAPTKKVLPPRPARPTATAPAKPGEVNLINVSNRNAAMVMAVVCDELKCNPSQVIFKSIKAL